MFFEDFSGCVKCGRGTFGNKVISKLFETQELQIAAMQIHDPNIRNMSTETKTKANRTKLTSVNSEGVTIK